MPSEALHFTAAGPDLAARLHPRMPLRIWRLFSCQLALGPSFALLAGDRPLALLGFVRIDAGVLELWMSVAPGLRRDQLAPAVIRLLVRRIRTIFPDDVILARIDDRNLPGQKLAFAGGFSPLDEALPDTRRRSWVRPPVILGETVAPDLRRRIVARLRVGNMTRQQQD